MVSIAFEHPQFLWFLLGVPFLIVTHFFLLRHTRRKAMKFANFSALKRVTGERFITKNYTILGIRAVIILCAVLAVAGTSVWREGTTNQDEYVIALDTSASMVAADVDPTRLEAAKEYAAKFVDNLDSDTRVGLVSFSGIVFIEQPLTFDKSAVKESLDAIEVTASGTDIPAALITSTNLLYQSQKGRAIILITDGSNTIQDFQSRSLQRASDYAQLNHVKIYTIGVGKVNTAPIGYLPTYYNVTAQYNEENLIAFANLTGGKYYHAVDDASLQQAYDDIRGSDKTSLLQVQLTSGLTLLCLLLILVEWGLINTRFRSIP
jgi:Ca-activated chloride channel homolog